MKNVFMNLIWTLILTFVSHQAWAGFGAHGGEGVVCRHPSTQKIQSLRLLDHYEGVTMINTSLEMGSSNSTYTEKIRYVLARLAQIDPISAERLQARADAFEANMQLLEESQMEKILDSTPLVGAGDGCKIEQFAYQPFPLKPLQKIYMVNHALWDFADSTTKAGLVLHEIIYTDALTLKQTTSDKTRYFNYIISSNYMDGIKPYAYDEVLRASGLGEGTTNRSCLYSYLLDGVSVCSSRSMPHYYSPVPKAAHITLYDGQVVPISSVGYNKEDHVVGFTSLPGTSNVNA